MNIFSAIFTALKNGAAEMGEANLNINTIDTFALELQALKAELGKAMQSGILLKTKQSQAQAKINEIEDQIATFKTNAINAVEKNDDALALSIAGEIVEMNQQLEKESSVVAVYAKNHSKIAQQIQQAQRQVAEMEAHLSQVKASAVVHKAQEAIHNNIAVGSVSSAKQSLAKIKAEQAETEAKLAVADEISSLLAEPSQAEINKVLDTKIQQAESSSTTAQQILNELKANK